MKNINLRDFLGMGLVSGFMIALFVLFWKAIPAQNEQLIVYMLGQLSGFVAGVVSYHYVMSKTSEKATENTGKAFEAITAASRGPHDPYEDDVIRAGDEVTVDKAEEKGKKK